MEVHGKIRFLRGQGWVHNKPIYRGELYGKWGEGLEQITDLRGAPGKKRVGGCY